MQPAEFETWVCDTGAFSDSLFKTFVSVCFNKNIHLRSPAFLSFSKMIKDVVVALCVRLSRSLIHSSLKLNLIG